MTRKDYVLIAEILKNFVGDSGDVIDRDKIALKLADALEAENPNFDYERFLVASGVFTGCSTCGSRMRYVTGQGEWCDAHLPEWAKKAKGQLSRFN